MTDEMVKDLMEILELWVLDDEQDIFVIHFPNKEIRLTKEVEVSIDSRQRLLDFSKYSRNVN
jgi:hypothetical protein